MARPNDMQHQVQAWKARSVMLTVDHEDEQGFKAARDLLLGRFTTWLARQGRSFDEETDELIGDAGVALDWKWTFGDGELATWRTGDVAEFLLDWCPRKLSVTQADCVTIPVALVSFFCALTGHRPGADGDLRSALSEGGGQVGSQGAVQAAQLVAGRMKLAQKRRDEVIATAPSR